MNRIDWIVLRRLAGNVGLAVGVIFAIFILFELLDNSRFVYLSQVGGLPLAVGSLTISGLRWTIRTLSVTVLAGSIMGILDLQTRQEMNIIRASGASIWQIVRAPLIAVAIAGLLIAMFVDSATTEIDRRINPTTASENGAVTSDGALWLEQQSPEGRYVMRAGQVQPGGGILNDVTIFLYGSFPFSRIIAPEARLQSGAWLLPTGIGYRADAAPRAINDLSLPTRTTPTDLQVRLSSTDDLTFFELATALAGEISDPLLANAVTTRFMRLSTLPLMMAGSVLVAFAFTAAYRRANKYGGAVLYGIVLGFVVFFVTEMADRAGSAGALI